MNRFRRGKSFREMHKKRVPVFQLLHLVEQQQARIELLAVQVRNLQSEIRYLREVRQLHAELAQTKAQQKRGRFNLWWILMK